MKMTNVNEPVGEFSNFRKNFKKYPHLPMDVTKKLCIILIEYIYQLMRNKDIRNKT